MQKIPLRVRPFTAIIPIEQILPWGGNPESRTSDLALAQLDEAIGESNTVVQVVAVNNGDDSVTLADGHRRAKVARARGFKELTVKVFPVGTNPGKLYMLLNSGNRSQSACDLLEAYLRGGTLPRNAKLAAKIKFCIRLLGSEDETMRVMLQGKRRISPNIVGVVQSAAVLLDGPSDRTGSGRGRGGVATITDTHRKLFNWIVEFGDSRIAALIATPLMKTNQKIRRLQSALSSNSQLSIE